MQFEKVGLFESFKFNGSIWLKFDNNNAINIGKKCIETVPRNAEVTFCNLLYVEKLFREVDMGDEFIHGQCKYLKTHNTGAFNLTFKYNEKFKANTLVMCCEL